MNEHFGFLKAAGCCPEHMKRQLLGQAPVNEVALAEMIEGRKSKKKTASYHHKRRISTGKVQKTTLTDVQDLRSTLIAQERRMGRETGKGNAVSAKKVWKKHTAKGGRTGEIRESLRRQLTFHMPSGDPEGVKTVQFRSSPAGKAKAKPKAKAAKKPAK
jgi:hypothetical protein